MDASEITQRLWDEQRRMGLDEDVFRYILWDVAWTGSPEGVDRESYGKVMAFLRLIDRQWGCPLTDEQKKYVHSMALDQIEEELGRFGVGLRYANRFSRAYFDVDSITWCSLDQLGEILREIRLVRERVKAKKAGRSE